MFPSFLTPRQQTTTSATTTVHAHGTAVVALTAAEFLGSLEANFNSIVRQHVNFGEQLAKFGEQLQQFKQLYAQDANYPGKAAKAAKLDISSNSEGTVPNSIEHEDLYSRDVQLETEVRLEKMRLFVNDLPNPFTSTGPESHLSVHTSVPSDRDDDEVPTDKDEEEEPRAMRLMPWFPTQYPSVDDSLASTVDASHEESSEFDAENSPGKTSPVNASNEESPQKPRMSPNGNDPAVHVETEGQEDDEFQDVIISHVVRNSFSSISDNEEEDEDLATPKQVEQLRNPSADDHVSGTEEEELLEICQPIRASTPTDLHAVQEVADMEEHDVEEAPYPQLPEQVNDHVERLVPRDVSPVANKYEGLDEDVVQTAAVLEEAPLATSLATEPLESEQKTAVSEVNDVREVGSDKHVEHEAMANPLFTQEPTSTTLHTETNDSPTIELVAEEVTGRALDSEERMKMATPIETHPAEPSTEAEITSDKMIAAGQDSPATELAAQEASAFPMDPEELPKMTTPIETPALESFTSGNTDSVIEVTAEQEVVILEAGNGDAKCEREPNVMLDNKTKRVVDAEEESSIGQATSLVTDEISRQASSEDEDKLQKQKAAPDNVTPTDETFVEEDDDKEQPETDPMAKRRRTTNRNSSIGIIVETETVAAPVPTLASKTRRGRIAEPTAASSRRRRSASKALSSSVEPEPISAMAPTREHIGVSEFRSSIEPEPLRIETGPVVRDETASMTAETNIDAAHSKAPSIEGFPFVGESSTGRLLRARKAPASRRSASIGLVADEGKRRSGRTKKAAATAAPQVHLTPSRKRGASEIVQTPAKRSKTTKAELSTINKEPTEEDVEKPVKRGRKKV
ncbi:hypothetical protein RUND412_010658 [Rhizina undulata]